MDAPEKSRSIAAARADFLSNGVLTDAPPGDVVPGLVAASWRRSAAAGVDIDNYAVRYYDDLEYDSRLAHCARPVLERLAEDLHDVPVTIALTDSRARLIERRDCSTSVGRVLDGVDFNPGFGFPEDHLGTNGVGTAFESGQPVSVVGSAHYHERLTPFACTGAPVRDPITGRIEGVLDVSQLADTWSPLVLALVKGAALDVGKLLLEDRDQARRMLFEAYAQADAHTRHGVIAVGDTVMLNQRAQRMLSAEEQVLVQDHARFLARSRGGATVEVGTEGGRRLRLRVEPVADAGSGLIVTVSEARDRSQHVLTDAGPDVPGHLPRPRAGRPEAPAEVDSHCAAWIDACAATRDAFEGGRSLLIVGEKGTGRSTLAVSTFRRLHADGVVVVLAASAAMDQTADLLPGSADGPVLLVVQEVDRLTDPGEAAVASLLARLSMTNRPVLVAATVEPERVADLDDRRRAVYAATAMVPAIRYRSADLAPIAGSMLAEMAPHRRVRLTPGALRAIAAYHWPDNLHQLREALSSALERRPAGDIDLDDLPGYCRARSARTLTTLQVAERDAILSALRACDGNRVRAAKQLGISRSSLYRKLDALAIAEV